MTCATLDKPKADTPAESGDAGELQVRARLQHLFRHALQAGEINPLLHIVIRHRLEDAA